MSDLASIIRAAAARYGVPPDVMLRIAQIESGMNPNAANPKSSARGVYQFMTRPGGSWDTYGRGQNPLDPHANVDAGARYIKDNIDTLRTKLGREPAGWEAYLAHQQGRGGAPALLSNPNQSAVATLAPLYKNANTARDAIVLNGGNANMTAGDFANVWKAKYEGTSVPSAAPGVAGAGDGGGAAVGAGVPNPGALNPLAIDRAGGGLGNIFADMLKPLEQDKLATANAQALLRKPKKSMSDLIGELGAPVELSSV